MKILLRALLVLLSIALAGQVEAKEEFSGLTTLQDAATATGDGTLLSVEGYNAVVVKLAVTGATVTWETGGATSDWVAIRCSLVGTNASATTASASGLYVCNTSGMSGFRARISSYSSGSVTVVAQRTTAYAGATSGFLFDATGNVMMALGTLLSGEDQDKNLLMTSGGAVRSTTMASAVTTDTTSAAVALPVGSKSIYGSVAGTGAITQTQKIYGGITSGVTSTTGILLCTLTLSGTTAVYDACPVMTANFLYYIVVTSATTGTGASGNVTAMY